MLPWIFIHGYTLNPGTSAHQQQSFNVAMDFHPWILVNNNISLFEDYWLQCCHGFSSMDTQQQMSIPQSKVECFNVAMDFHPWILQDSHFNSSCQMSFNVAMDFHPWIPEYCPLTQTLHDPLQCCHGFSSMDTTTADTSFQPLSSLQCCHGFSSMDTRVFLHSSMVRTIASMLPWIFIHGY